MPLPSPDHSTSTIVARLYSFNTHVGSLHYDIVSYLEKMSEYGKRLIKIKKVASKDVLDKVRGTLIDRYMGSSLFIKCMEIHTNSRIGKLNDVIPVGMQHFKDINKQLQKYMMMSYMITIYETDISEIETKFENFINCYITTVRELKDILNLVNNDIDWNLIKYWVNI